KGRSRAVDQKPLRSHADAKARRLAQHFPRQRFDSVRDLGIFDDVDIDTDAMPAGYADAAIGPAGPGRDFDARGRAQPVLLPAAIGSPLAETIGTWHLGAGPDRQKRIT